VVAERAALLFKTIYHWLSVARDTKEGRALNHLYTVVNELKKFDATNLSSVSIEDVKVSLASLRDVLRSPTLRGLINEDFIRFVADPTILETSDPTTLQLLRFRAREAQKAVKQFGKFDASTADIFFRPGLIDFRSIAMLIGHIADFYAGYSPDVAPLWRSFFDECTASALGKLPWDVLQGSCGERFSAMVDRAMTHNDSIKKHRVDESVGEHFNVIAGTAVLVTGQDKLEEAWKRYQLGKEADLALNASQFKFGYTGTPSALAYAASHIMAEGDLKSSMFTSLGVMKWGDFLAISPAEPGLTNAQRFVDGTGKTLYSFGGWSDLSPVQILKASGGCPKVIYITRQGSESVYAQAVAARAGFESVLDKLFSATDPASSYYQATHKADAIYCTNWNQFDGFATDGIRGLWQDSYIDTKLYTHSDDSAPVGCRK
jgi:hypothetical protein